MVDLNKVRTVNELETENAQIKLELNAAHKTLDKLLKELNKKSEEIAHLQSMLTQVVPIIKTPEKKEFKAVTAEAEIAELQLERLRQAARQRVLTLEETRAFDLLVKNKRLSQDESTINLNKSQFRDVSEADLLQIAGKSDESNKG